MKGARSSAYLAAAGLRLNAAKAAHTVMVVQDARSRTVAVAALGYSPAV